MKQNVYKMTARERSVEDWFEWPMIFVTVGLIVTMLVPVLFEMSYGWVQAFAGLNLIIWLAFYVELVVKFSVSANLKETLKRNWFLCVIAVSPLFLSFRLIYISRVVGLTRILGLQKVIKKLNKKISSLVYSVEYILITLFSFTMVSALIMWQVELRFDGGITSFSDALWWAVVTVTTIGYGDVIPLSAEGKVVGAIVAMLGVVLFMVFVAKVTSVFLKDK